MCAMSPTTRLPTASRVRLQGLLGGHIKGMYICIVGCMPRAIGQAQGRRWCGGEIRSLLQIWWVNKFRQIYPHHPCTNAHTYLPCALRAPLSLWVGRVCWWSGRGSCPCSDPTWRFHQPSQRTCHPQTLLVTHAYPRRN